jgi:uncharacterized membrane protein YeaQ/YmgE (transglycosylase-associated protein family)
MNVEELIILLVVGAIAGWVAGMLMSKKRSSLPINIIVGIIGAVIGRYLFDLLDISIRGFAGSLISATAGAVLLLFIVKLIKK